MILYSIRRGPHGYQLGKFDDDFNVAAIYDVDLKHCTCPAGPRPSCKHRKMLPRMLGKVDTEEFYCYETQTWHQPLAREALGSPKAEPTPIEATGRQPVGEGKDEPTHVVNEPEIILPPAPLVPPAAPSAPAIRRR